MDPQWTLTMVDSHPGGHSPWQAGGDAEQVHDVAGVTVLAENHLQNRGAPDSEVAEEQLVPMVMSDYVLPLSSDPKVYFKKKKPYSPSSGMSQYIFPFV